ncbi:hypothetical protein Tco_1135816 [Tanacetum coccineum]
MSIQDMEDLKQQYLDEMQSIINQIQIKDYRNERIDIRYRRECEIKIDELKGKFNGMNIEINKKKELRQLEQAANLSAYTTEPSVEDLVPIPSESEDTSNSDSECDLPFCDNFMTFSNPLFNDNDDFTSSDDESLLEEDVPEENFKIYSNLLFEFDDEYISSDVNPLFNKVLEDIESEDSYVSKLDEPALPCSHLFSMLMRYFRPRDLVENFFSPLFEFDDEYISSDVNPLFDEVLEDIENKDPCDSDLDEPALLVTTLFDFNEDECFDPGGDVDEIELLLHRDPSTPKISFAFTRGVHQ